MYFSETVLWWLLTIRARREEQREHGLEKELRRQGRVTWWECGLDEQDPAYSDRRDVAQALGVETRFYTAPGEDYSSDYRQLLEDLKETLSV